jgi:hypothetical protein
MARHTSGKRFYIHAPAVKGIRSRTTGDFVSTRLIRINRPFAGAEAWQHNVFYFWWEFLKRHEGYKDCCDRGGAGRYKKLYADWGNIHAHETQNFWHWWSEKISDEETRGEFLFAEPDARQIRITDKLTHSEKSDTLLLAIPIEVRTAYLVTMLRRLLKDQNTAVAAARRISRARYKVAANVALASLYQTLRVYDVWQEHKHSKLKKYELCVMAGVSVNRVVNSLKEEDGTISKGETVEGLKRLGLPYADVERTVRRRQTQAFERHLMAAQDYIEHAITSFPMRSK